MAEAAGAETNKLANAITAINGAFRIRNITSLLLENSGNPAPSTCELATANPLRLMQEEARGCGRHHRTAVSSTASKSYPAQAPGPPTSTGRRLRTAWVYRRVRRNHLRLLRPRQRDRVRS